MAVILNFTNTYIIFNKTFIRINQNNRLEKKLLRLLESFVWLDSLKKGAGGKLGLVTSFLSPDFIKV